jgi:hypothetical protein
MTSKTKSEDLDLLVDEIEVAAVIKKLLQLEKELSLPDIQLPDSVRADRIMSAIEGENF